MFEFGVCEPCVVVKPLECKRGVASKLNGQLEFTVVIEKASDADHRQYELEKQVWVRIFYSYICLTYIYKLYKLRIKVINWKSEEHYGVFPT